MRKLLIAALLGGCVVVPAQAAIILELKGTYTGAYFDLDSPNPGAPMGYFGGKIEFSGQCIGQCWGDASSAGIWIKDQGFSGYNITFLYDEPAADPLDGIWRSGNGSGDMFAGYIQYNIYDFVITHGRAYDDGNPDSSSYPFPSMRTFDSYYYGVPEPATWAMMIGGFALVGASMRRRKLAVSFA